MPDTEARALRRFCYIAGAVLLTVFAVCLLCMLTGRALPIVAYPLIFTLLVLMQHLISTDLYAYAGAGRSHYLERVGYAVCILLVAFFIDIAGKLTSDMTLLLILAAQSIYPLLDIVHTLIKINRRRR